MMQQKEISIHMGLDTLLGMQGVTFYMQNLDAY